MSRDTAQGRSHRPLVGWLAVLSLAILMFAPATVSASAHTTTKSAAAADKSTVCGEVANKTIEVSSGAQMYCFGPQFTTGGNKPGSFTTTTSSTFSKNVDAANPKEDITPNGTQAYGQSEVSVAGTGSYVLEAWNDATGFFSPACSPEYKDQLTGWGFSSNGGGSFTDEGGLPNTFCANSSWSGDPSVETWTHGGTKYFYASSLFSTSTSATVETCGSGSLCVAVTACKVSSGISCNPTPVTLADYPGSFNFEDKDFMSIDPKHGVLYISFTDFNGPTGDDITLWECNVAADPGLTNPADCHGPLYIASSNGCENEGAYPAANINTGDVYVAYEHNWATNQTSSGLCATDHVQNRINKVPSTCTMPAATFPANAGCTGEDTYPEAAINIVSMDSAFVPGYNRFPANDFPRIAVSTTYGTVSIVWNDARSHPLGDIFLQSFHLGTFPAAVQSNPVRINTQSAGGLHFLPALRNDDSSGLLDISFYQRADEDTTLTNVYAALRVNPKTTSTPGSNYKVTDATSDWNAASSDIVPNFGDYTDNYVIATTSGTYTGTKLYVAWSDGRIGDPQPFEAYTTAG